MRRSKERGRYFMGLRLPIKTSPLVDRMTERERMEEHLLSRRYGEAAMMLRQTPELIVFFTETLYSRVQWTNPFEEDAEMALAKACAEQGDQTILMLAQMLDHEQIEVRKLAMRALKLASDEGVDILFALKALERKLNNFELGRIASGLLTEYHLKGRKKAEIEKLLESTNEIVQYWSVKVLGTAASNGDKFAISLLIEACSDENATLRKHSASNLAAVLFRGTDEVKQLIREEVEKLRKRDMVYLEIFREIIETEKLLRAAR
ncbi:hypothetical protein KKB44_06640 [Candidatus Micrarchaeota archaeon]|nr:hypothetical protein [Candidatus Micrarchaeota archaeon]